MPRKLSLILFIMVGVHVSCKEEKKGEEKAPVVQLPQDQLTSKLTILEDSIRTAWASMLEEDDKKIAYTKRLLDEISYTKKYDVITQTKLMTQCNALKNKRFVGDEVEDSQSIDRYDAATDSLLRGVNALVLSTPDVENYPLVSELTQEVTAMDNNVVVKRIHYDKWASQYNQVVEEQKETLAKLGPPYSEKKKKKLFQLEQ